MAGLLVCVCVAMWRVFKTGERNEGGFQLCKPAWLWPGVLTHTREELLQAFREPACVWGGGCGGPSKPAPAMGVATGSVSQRGSGRAL